MPGQLLSCRLQAAADGGIRSYHPARHLEQPALHFLELVVVGFLFLHLHLQVRHMALVDRVDQNRKEDEDSNITVSSDVQKTDFMS